MKDGIHPKYGKTTVACVCGNVFETRTTSGKEVRVEICSNCHPFFTGRQKLIDTAGRVERFLKKYGMEDGPVMNDEPAQADAVPQAETVAAAEMPAKPAQAAKPAQPAQPAQAAKPAQAAQAPKADKAPKAPKAPKAEKAGGQ